MSVKSTTKSSFRYWAYLAITLGFLIAGLASNSLVFTSREWLDTLIHGAIATLCAFTVLIIPRLLSLAINGQDIPAIRDFFS